MRNFKTIDCWINGVLIPVFVVYGFICMNENSLAGYYIVGAWQVISMIIHQYKHWFTAKNDARRSYHRFVLILLIILALLLGLIQLHELFFIPLMFVLFFLLYVSPFMAAYYAYLCYDETYVQMKRPMELLK